MKKSLQHLMTKMVSSDRSSVSLGFFSINGGAKVNREEDTNNGPACTRSNVACTNQTDCTDSTNVGGVCTNVASCFL